MRSSRSNTATVCPARVSCCAAARPAGPEPTTATVLPVRRPGRLRLHPAVAEGLVDDRHLDLLDGHGGLVDGEHAGRLAGRRAESPGELGEVVRGVQALDRRAALAAPHQVVPLGDQVAERAALVAERDAAVHAAAGLAAQLGGVALLVDLFPVHDAHRHGPTLRQLALGDLQKALRVSHPSPPCIRRAPLGWGSTIRSATGHLQDPGPHHVAVGVEALVDRALAGAEHRRVVARQHLGEPVERRVALGEQCAPRRPSRWSRGAARAGRARSRGRRCRADAAPARPSSSDSRFTRPSRRPST